MGLRRGFGASDGFLGCFPAIFCQGVIFWFGDFPAIFESTFSAAGALVF